MIMEPEKINHPYLTAIKRTDFSVPTRYLMQHQLLKGKILDFGCGFGFDTDELKSKDTTLQDMIITIGPTSPKESLIPSSVIMY